MFKEARNWFRGTDQQILAQSMGTRNRVGIGLLYRPARARICKPFKEPGIDSQPGGPVRQRQPYLLYRLARLHRLAELIPRNRFLGSLNVYKYGLRLHWLAELVPWNRFLGSITWRTKTNFYPVSFFSLRSCLLLEEAEFALLRSFSVLE